MSTLITACGPSRGTNPKHERISPSRRDEACSFSTIHVRVNEVTHSRTTNIFCLSHLIMSDANMQPTTSGGSDVVCGTVVLGSCSSAIHL